MEPRLGRRIHVIGTSGAGKTTLASRISRLLGLPHVELDALHWGPDWTPVPRDDFRAAVFERLAEDGWVVDGNYGNSARDLVWARADTIVWLDLPRATVMRQVVSRTLSRWWREEELWHGNRERLRISLASRESVIWWAWSTYARRRAEYTKLLATVPQRVIRLESRSAVEDWVAAL